MAASTPVLNVPSTPKGAMKAAGSRKALLGFFVSGVLFCFPGAILPAWGHHRTSDYSVVSGYFLTTALGILVSAWFSAPLLRRKGAGWLLTFSCGLAAAGLLYMAAVSPPVAYWWRMAGLLILGLAGGSLHSAIFHAIESIYQHDAAATVNLAGILFGLGCLLMAILAGGTFFLYTVPSIQILTAAIPGLFALWYARSQFDEHAPPRTPSPRDLAAEFRSPWTVLLGMLVFFQFGNESAVAGWLAVFLIQRLGISPASGLWLLALYWFGLLIGRALTQGLLPKVSHARLLMASSGAAVFGAAALLGTNNLFGAAVGTLAIGLGFAPIYPLVIERIGGRIPNYHPGFYNGVVSLAFAGGLLAPSASGFFAGEFGLRAAMWLPLAGSLAVAALVGLIWLEARIAGRPASARP